jgi:hypothetical protein
MNIPGRAGQGGGVRIVCEGPIDALHARLWRGKKLRERGCLFVRVVGRAIVLRPLALYQLAVP